MSLKQCPVCKTACPLDAQVCPQCGHKFRTVFDPQGQQQPAPQPAPQNLPPQPVQVPMLPPVQTPAPQQMPQPGYAPRLEQHGRAPSRPLPKWLIGVFVVIGLGIIGIVILANTRFINHDLVGHWRCLNPDKNVSEVTFNADGTGFSNGSLGKGEFKWEGNANRIHIIPTFYNPTSQRIEEGSPHWLIIQISEDKQRLNVDYETPPSGSESEPAQDFVRE